MNNKYWLEAKNIYAFKNGHEVVKNLSLKLKKEEMILILGPNGSGKSSIVDLINRNIYPIQNKDSYLKILGKELIDIWELRKKISTVNNDIKLRINPELRVLDVIISGLYGKYCYEENKSNNDFIVANDLIEKLSIENIRERKFGYLSDGEKQITIIARAIINNPEILILDEPVINLDLRSKYFLINKIKALSKLNISILCITHDITIITKDYNRVIFLKNKKIILDGKPSENMKSEYISNLFDVDIEIIENKNSWEVYRK